LICAAVRAWRNEVATMLASCVTHCSIRLLL
jgi:hypothetical protein